MFNFFLCKDSHEIYKFTALVKFLTLIQKEFFQFISKFCKCPWNIHSSKNNFGVSRSRSVVNKKISLTYAFFYFLNWKDFSDIRKNNPLLSKPRLKYLVYCQVFWVKVWPLQYQCWSIWTLVFHYFISNILFIVHVQC